MTNVATIAAKFVAIFFSGLEGRVLPSPSLFLVVGTFFPHYLVLSQKMPCLNSREYRLYYRFRFGYPE